MNLKEILKKHKAGLITGAVLGMVLGVSLGGPSTEQVASVGKAKDLGVQVEELGTKVSTLEKENKTLKDKVAEAEPWFKMEKEKRDEEVRKKEEAKKKEEEKKETERKKKEEAEKKRKEEEEKKGYETGITYDNLARTPDKYKGKKVKFKGKVLQVMEDSGIVGIRLAVNSDYNKVIYLTMIGQPEKRILEDDVITIMGTSEGLMTYESTMGKSITIPSIYVDKIQ